MGGSRFNGRRALVNIHSNSEVDYIDKIKVLKRFDQTDKQL